MKAVVAGEVNTARARVEARSCERSKNLQQGRESIPDQCQLGESGTKSELAKVIQPARFVRILHV